MTAQSKRNTNPKRQRGFPRESQPLGRTRRLTEKQFMGQVIALANMSGWLVYHTHNSRRSEPGFPDLILMKGQRLLAIELKVGQNKPTADQRKWLLAFHKTGALATVWTPADWSDIERELLK